MVSSLIDYQRLRRDLPGSAAVYVAADPFPHTVIDGVLTQEAFDGVVAEFPAVDDPFWRGYLHVNETKFSNTQPDTWAPSLQAVAQEFCSPEFVGYLRDSGEP